MKTPIFVFDEADDLYIFNEPHHVDRYCEVEDVRDGVYAAFDREGKALEFRIVRRKQPILFGLTTIDVEAPVLVDPNPNAPPRAQGELQRRLTSYLSHPNWELSAENLGNRKLEDLRELGLKYGEKC